MATKNSDKTLKQLLVEGLTDALGFIGGAILCYWLGTLLGFDMAVAGNTSSTGIISIVIMLVGGGFGLILARRRRNI